MSEDQVFVVHQNKRLVGPLSLEDAFAAAEEDPATGAKMVLSCPNADYVAIRLHHGAGRTACLITVVRKVNHPSGRDGSEMGTGKWIPYGSGIADNWIPNSWRPA